ncbi:MAG TPA: cytochrome c oxidase assembly protein, partial [Pseudonocardiaceae bacterium]|nr:cytochrome c oxidase assembly protein [Pseudonocardiaceae bacterium]
VFFGISLTRLPEVIGSGFYRSLALPFVPDLLADQRLGAVISWVAGEIPMVIVLIVLLVRWVSYSETRETSRFESAVNTGGDAEPTGYDALLTQLAQRPPARD